MAFLVIAGLVACLVYGINETLKHHNGDNDDDGK
tara:strand:+ start:210 stop:311 length:102 start_codon:yes stop_codon:yes gene_type:complete